MFSYEPFWETVKKKDLNWYRLVHAENPKMRVTPGVLQRIKHGKPISVATLDYLCSILDCDISDIVKHIPDEPSDTDN